MQELQEYDFHTRLMGTSADVTIVSERQNEAERAYERALLLGQEMEARFSRFRPESELSRLNTSKHACVSPEFLEALITARTLYRESAGTFNVLLRVRSLGYNTDFEHMEREVSLQESVSYNTDVDAIQINEHAREVVLLPDQELDFGGFMKGYAAQRMAHAAGPVPGVIINLGGDCFTRGLDKEGVSFSFSVYNPVTNEHPVQLTVRDAAIATSGTYRRSWKLNSSPVHHILGSASESEALVSATVCDASGALAECYATTAIALGRIRGVQFLERNASPYVCITSEGDLIRNTTV